MKKLAIFIIIAIISVASVQIIRAQIQLANPPDAVGPELAFFDPAGQQGVHTNVIVPNDFHGAVQVINMVGFQNPVYNPSPGTNVTLRLAGITSTTPPTEMVDFALKLNASNEFPGRPVVIVGNEMNNLDLEWKANPMPAFNDGAALAREARKYAVLYKAFAGALDRNKYQVAPAPPDLYNGNWNPVPWVDAFAASDVCGSIDVLIANVFNVQSRVGTGPLDTHTYLQRKLCNKPLNRFGGWGSDPNLSVAEQVKFLNETALPPGITAATTLIVDNCGGNQGNVVKSGWMYYIRGEVFRANGEKVDPENCSSSGTPYELLDISCDDTTRDKPEFHSLRPYPASTCDRNVSRDVYMCGNDLVVKETLKFVPSDGQCEPLPAPDSGQRCYFFVRSSSNVNLGLSSADLPILGNTELVPNSTNAGSSGLSFVQRLNEYVSWYLNGTTYRAEEEPEDLAGAATPEERKDIVHRIINFSGPLKKLLPRTIQTVERNNERARIGNERHDQIVTCNDPNNPEACYTTSDDYLRISEILPVPNLQGFPYIPYSSTEDLIGEGESKLTDQFPDFDCSTAVPPTDRNIFGVNCANFSAVKSIRNLYFAHTEEVKELGTLLQSTFKPQGIDDTGTASLVQYNDQNDRNKTKFCEIVESRRNPGDKLYGDLARDGEEPINGTLSYTANVICDFKNPPPEEIAACQANCVPFPEADYAQCLSECGSSKQECTQEIFVPFQVRVSMPNAHTIWEKLVAGSQSIVKRIFPLIGPNAPIEELKDIPGETNASYSSANQGVSGGGLDSADTIAGNPAEGRPGSSAKIFFPHLGSVYDYFLHGIQEALRPKGIKFDGTTPTPTPPSSTLVNCNKNAPEPNLGPWTGKVVTKQTLIEYITAGARLFPDLISLQNMHDCWNDIVGQALAAGYDPALSLAIWAEESWASNYTDLARYNLVPVADMGCAVNTPRNDFAAQSACWHRLKSAYGSSGHFTAEMACRTDSNGCLTMRDFLMIFEGGGASCRANDFVLEPLFPDRIRQYYGLASNGQTLNFNQVLSCPS